MGPHFRQRLHLGGAGRGRLPAPLAPVHRGANGGECEGVARLEERFCKRASDGRKPLAGASIFGIREPPTRHRRFRTGEDLGEYAQIMTHIALLNKLEGPDQQILEDKVNHGHH